jgi:predicted flavoprotein YhiN
LNVVGPCGGYNLHWAFATGKIAAEHINVAG